MKQLMTGLAVALAAAAFTTPPAHADGNIDEFNQYLLQRGITNEVAMNGVSYVQNGWNACAALQAGRNAEQVLLQSGMDRAGAKNVVFAAQHYLCPGA
jgi:Protein of unknown function (DUF732)